MAKANQDAASDLERPALPGRRRIATPREPKDSIMFRGAIKAAARDLDFALQMYAVELGVQLFTEDEIEAELRRAFFAAAAQILGRGWPQGDNGHGGQIDA